MSTATPTRAHTAKHRRPRAARLVAAAAAVVVAVLLVAWSPQLTGALLLGWVIFDVARHVLRGRG